MTNPRFQRSADGFIPAPSSHAPWSTDMLHGRLIGGLGARAIEALVDGASSRITRLTVDLFRPAGMGPVSLRTTPVRQGRRLQVIDVVVSSDGSDVARITGLVLATGTEPSGKIWQPEPWSWPDPAVLVESSVDVDGWLMQTAGGGFGSGEQTRMWTNDGRPLVDDEPLSPLVRAAISGDIACPLANSSDNGLHYINADYTLTLGRYPVGPWIGLEVAHHVAADGLSLGSCTLVDETGPFALSTGSSLATEPLEEPASL